MYFVHGKGNMFFANSACSSYNTNSEAQNTVSQFLYCQAQAPVLVSEFLVIMTFPPSGTHGSGDLHIPYQPSKVISTPEIHTPPAMSWGEMNV